MPELRECICPDSCIQADHPVKTDPTWETFVTGILEYGVGPTTSVLRPSEPHPWYCSTFKPAFQSLTYISPSVVT